MQKSTKILLWILGIVIVISAIGITYTIAKKSTTSNTATPSQNQSQNTNNSTNTTPEIVHVSDPGVTWLAEPVKLDDLGLIKKTQDNYISDVTYYQVANLDNGGSIILASANMDMPGSPEFAYFKKDADGNYAYILNQSFEQDSTAASKDLNNAKIDYTTVYQSLSAPAFLDANGNTLKSTLSKTSRKLFSDLKSPTEIADTPYGKIYQTVSGAKSDELTGTVLNLRLADGSTVQYSPKFNFMPSTEIPIITWNDGTKNAKRYTPESYSGCGSSSANYNIIINTDNIKTRLTQIGKTNNNEVIYGFTSSNDPVVKAAYENYSAGRSANDTLSLEDFAAQKPIFVYKDGFNDYVVFTGRDFAGAYGCGKPVIYLYPEKTTEVSVKVGADITKSEPFYNNGWNALAEPNGQLIVDGKMYDSLFWEGIGQEYPEIDCGKIVEKNNIENALRQDLAQLGLNSKESQDFLDFWLPKMPNNPYIRLTWFGTSQMNKLAPLAVSPKPDTTIRIFLDFAGLDKPIDLPAQKLSAPARNGFTLVEWGGILRGEIK